MRNQKIVVVGAVTDFTNMLEVRLTSLENLDKYKIGCRVRLTGIVNRSFGLPHFAVGDDKGNMEVICEPTPESVAGVRKEFRYLKYTNDTQDAKVWSWK